MRGKRTKVEELTERKTNLASGGGRPLPRKTSELSSDSRDITRKPCKTAVSEETGLRRGPIGEKQAPTQG